MNEIGFRRSNTQETGQQEAAPVQEPKKLPPVEEAVASIETYLAFGIVASAAIVGDKVVLLRNTRVIRTH